MLKATFPNSTKMNVFPAARAADSRIMPGTIEGASFSGLSGSGGVKEEAIAVLISHARTLCHYKTAVPFQRPAMSLGGPTVQRDTSPRGQEESRNESQEGADKGYHPHDTAQFATAPSSRTAFF